MASQIDWNLTIIAAFSFLLHFGLVGAMYSDWMDPVVNDDLTAGLLDMVQKTVPPPTRDRRGDAHGQRDDAPTPPLRRRRRPSRARPRSRAAPRRRTRRSSPGLMNEADQARIAILAALNGGANIKGAMNDDNGAPVDLNSLANRSGGFTNSNSLVSGMGGGGPIQPGKGGGGLQDLHGGNTGGASTTAGPGDQGRPRRRRASTAARR